jgi:hypothetical protein
LKSLAWKASTTNTCPGDSPFDATPGRWDETANAVNGFVVEIVRSHDGRVPNGWLAEAADGFEVVSDRRHAWVFPTREDAQTQAERYHEAHRGRFAKYVIRAK